MTDLRPGNHISGSFVRKPVGVDLRTVPSHAFRTSELPQDTDSRMRITASSYHGSYPPFEIGAASRQEEGKKTVSFACPVFKDETLSGSPHSCNGVVATNMSEIRRHLNRAHKLYPKLCKICYEDILDEEEFQTKHGAHCHTPRAQPRGFAIEQWSNLYKKLYPNAEKIPEPGNESSPKSGQKRIITKTAETDSGPTVRNSVISHHDVPYIESWSNLIVTPSTRETRHHETSVSSRVTVHDGESILSREERTPSNDWAMPSASQCDDVDWDWVKEFQQLTGSYTSSVNEILHKLPEDEQLRAKSIVETTLAKQLDLTTLSSAAKSLAAESSPEIIPTSDHQSFYVLSGPTLHSGVSTPLSSRVDESGDEMDVVSGSPGTSQLNAPKASRVGPSFGTGETGSASFLELPDPLHCGFGDCTVVFTGAYRGGNRSRHIRLQHRVPQSSGYRIYACEDDSCDRTFKRQDARLKHYRKQHPQLGNGPVARRKIRSPFSV